MSHDASTAAERGLAEQGYYELAATDRRRLDGGLRFTPAVMLAAAMVGLIARQPLLHGTLAAIGALALAAPSHHPLDLVYNHGVRHLLGAPRLPPNPLPRRLGMLGAAALNLAVFLAFGVGRDGLAYGFGALLVATQLPLVARQTCVVSELLGHLVRARNRPRRLLTGGEARRLVTQGALLVDVRSPREFADGHLPGAVNVPIAELERRVDELLERHRPLVLYCSAGVRCNRAARLLNEAGSHEVHQLGTMRRWSEPA